ncbi:MAG: MFS transporter [Betaproteobacteria bacterium]|nr:MFS transporter [Betaproteobacteria bacterium]
MSTRTAQIAARFFRASPLRHASFRLFYLGSIAAATGYTMQATVAAWLMATLTPSAILVALVQTASTVPTLLFGLLAGALADIVDRGKVILVTQIVLAAATAVLGIAVLLDMVGPVALLAATFLIGAGFTLYIPAQQASINDLVGRADLPRALGLSAAGFNVARAVGPAIAGAIAAWLGSGSALLASALFFGTMIVAVRAWRKSGPAIPGVPERLLSGIQSGLRYARHSPLMRALIGRCLIFCVCASALWALLPMIARDQLGLGAAGFGMLSASFGIGGVIAALTIPSQLHRLSLNTVVNLGFLLWAAAALIIASTGIAAVALAGTCAAGVAWVGVLPSLGAGTQSAAPAWVRARAVAMTFVAMQASLALGSVIWGWLAALHGIRIALAASALVMLALLALSYRVRVRMGDEAEVTPAMQLPELAIAVEPSPDDGPVLIQVQYQIDPGNREAFLHAIHLCEGIRRRNGASDWRVFRDLGNDGRFVERFIVASWAEYVRLRSRMSVADQQIRDRMEQFQQPGAPIQITRLISTNLRDAATAAPTDEPLGADGG